MPAAGNVPGEAPPGQSCSRVPELRHGGLAWPKRSPNSRPIPPIRQRDRFENLQLEEALHVRSAASPTHGLKQSTACRPSRSWRILGTASRPASCAQETRVMLLQGRSPECFVASRLSLAAIAGPQPFTLCRQLQGAEPGEGTGEAGREGVRSEAKRPSFAPLCSSLLLALAGAATKEKWSWPWLPRRPGSPARASLASLFWRSRAGPSPPPLAGVEGLRERDAHARASWKPWPSAPGHARDRELPEPVPACLRPGECEWSVRPSVLYPRSMQPLPQQQLLTRRVGTTFT